MSKKWKQRLCGFIGSGHGFRNSDTKSIYNEKDYTITIIETCYKCGKTFSFTAPMRNFGG